MRINVKGAIVPNGDKWIYDWFGIDATCPKDVADAIDKAGGQKIEVEINSGGGDIFAGSEIYTALRAYPGGVSIHIVGLAASAASVISMAGYCEMSPTAMMMVHNVSSYADGDYREMDHKADVLRQANKTIAAAYIGKTGMSEKDALALMDDETWLTATQAKEKGLVDAVMFNSAPQIAASVGSEMLPKSVLDKIRNTVKDPVRPESGIFMPDAKTRAQAELKLLDLKGRIIE